MEKVNDSTLVPSQTAVDSIALSGGSKSALSIAAYNAIVIIFALTIALCIIGFSITIIYVVIKDGSSPLVEDMAGKMTIMLLAGFTTILGMVSGPEFLAQVRGKK